ncbi:MAG: glycosyltransferase family 4 protein [Saprospiraceae bacterium]|nr:glycosyltransferase family 4 protein [Saprospiraceae bacterium]
MKILQICKKFPYPIKDGEGVAVDTLSRGFYENGCQVDLLAFNTSKHFVHVDSTSEDSSHYNEVHSIFLDNAIDPFKLIINLFQDISFNIERFNSSRMHLKLKEMLENKHYDLVQLESLYMAPYISTIRKYSKAKIAMRSHNLEHEIWKNLAKGQRNPLKKWYFNLAAKRLLKYEQKAFNLFDTLVPISEIDFNKYETLNYNGPYCVCPVGLNMSNYKSNENILGDTIRLGYIGSLDWIPNIEGIIWFVNKVWNRIRAAFPNVEFHLAGRNAVTKLIQQLPDTIQFHGEVEDAKKFLQDLNCVIVPLFAGSGIRVKILESMAMGKVVMSSQKGFEGIPIKNGVNGFIIDSSNDIINALEQLISDKYLFGAIGEKAKSTIKDTFDYKVISKKLLDHYQSLSDNKLT